MDVPPVPDIDSAIAPPRREPPYGPALPRAHHPTRRNRRRPTHAIYPDPVRREYLLVPAVVLELEHADVAVAAGAREQAARLVRGPGYQVDRRSV